MTGISAAVYSAAFIDGRPIVFAQPANTGAVDFGKGTDHAHATFPSIEPL
jgi:hypothetical protein